MKFITDYKLENFILNTQWEDLPEEVQKRAVVCGIDLTIALLLGSKGQQFQAGLRMAREHYKEGKVPVVGSPETFGILGASVAMSHASNSFDIDDGHNMIKGHPGTSFVGGVLAAALEQGVDAVRINPGNIGGLEKLRAVVETAKAHDAAIRIGVNSG